MHDPELEYRPVEHERVVPRWALGLLLVLTVLSWVIVSWTAARTQGVLAAVFTLFELPFTIPSALGRELSAGRWATAAVLGSEIALAVWLAGAWYWRVRRPLVARQRTAFERPRANESLQADQREGHGSHRG